MPAEPTEKEKCRAAALRLLERRAYSQEELRRKLVQRKFAAAVVRELLLDFVGCGLLNDAAYAQNFVEVKLQGRAGRSVTRVRQDLRRHGIDANTAGTAMLNAGDAAGADAELARALPVAATKWRQVTGRGTPDLRLAKGKLYRFLAGRGFSADTCRLAIDQVTGEPLEI